MMGSRTDFDSDFSPRNLFDSFYLPNDVYIMPSDIVKSNDKLSLLHINSRSILSKLNDIQVLIDQCGANIIAVTETWLNSDNEDFVSINGFKFISSCGFVDRGGGVGLFISNNISFKIVDFASFSIRVTSFEFLLVKIIQPKSTDTYVGVVYRHPNSNIQLFNLEFFNIIDYFKNKNIFLLGDFNIDLLTASLHQYSSQFYDNVASCSLLPVFTKPTRITLNSQTTIDNILTNFPLYNCTSTIIIDNISDHFPIFLQIPINYDKLRIVRISLLIC